MKFILIAVLWYTDSVSQIPVATYPDRQSCLKAAEVYETAVNQGSWVKGVCIPAPSSDTK